MSNFARGAKPCPRHVLAAATPFKPLHDVLPTQVAYVPTKLSYWLNNATGDCVTAEEAFNKAASGIFIQDSTVQTWAGKYGFLNGAMLPDVMDQMAKSGFAQDGNVYGDGGYKSVDYSNEAVLQAALAIAPVKIGIDANALPSGAGNGNGWHSVGGGKQNFNNEDHCVTLAGYGPAAWLFQQLGVALPSGIDGTKVCYLLFTWNSIGVVDHDWIMSTTQEAWLRDPSSITNGQPLPNPGPKPTPPIPVPPVPVPTPNGGGVPVWAWITIGAVVLGFVLGLVAILK